MGSERVILERTRKLPLAFTGRKIGSKTFSYMRHVPISHRYTLYETNSGKYVLHYVHKIHEKSGKSLVTKKAIAFTSAEEVCEKLGCSEFTIKALSHFGLHAVEEI